MNMLQQLLDGGQLVLGGDGLPNQFGAALIGPRNIPRVTPRGSGPTGTYGHLNRTVTCMFLCALFGS